MSTQATDLKHIPSDSPGGKTTYHILREVTGGDISSRYEPIAANVEAPSAAAAIRKTATATGTYVAVPSRSFVPTKVTLTQQTVVKID